MATIPKNRRQSDIKNDVIRRANNNDNNSTTNNNNKSNTASRGSLASNPNSNITDTSQGSKAQKNNTSLVRDGYSSLGNNGKARAPKPKAKVQPTRREPKPTTDLPGQYSAGGDGDGDGVRDGDVDSRYNNNNNNSIGDSNHQDDIASGNFDGSNNYSNSENLGTGRPATDRGNGPKADKKGKAANDPPSVRQRFYETADMDDVLQAKIATQLRENGVAETRVVALSAKIAQAVRDDVMGEKKTSQPQVVSNLSSAIRKHLDVILHNYPNHTDLSHLRPNDASAEMSHMVLMRLAQVQDELEICKSSIDSALQTSRRPKLQGDRDNAAMAGEEMVGSTPRDQQERSMVMAIKEGIDEQKTQLEIVEEKVEKLEKENEEVEELKQKHAEEIQLWDEENLQLKKYLTEADQDNETLVSKVKEQQQEYEKLGKVLQTSQKEVERLKKQIEELVSQGHISVKELAALQSEKARLQVLCDQRQKEILHLRDPDRDLLYQIRSLTEEVTALRTQTRRLTEEKGMLRAKTQKMESVLDESLKQRNKITSERDVLFKENQEVRQKYRKLTLSTPAQRTLPEIMTPRTRPTSRATTLLTTRANSRAESNLLVVKNNGMDDSGSKLPTHTEETPEVPEDEVAR